MSRCFPYPPPGYVKNGIRDEALIESIKIKREEEKAKKERKKEKKEKKEKKREKKERDNALDSGETKSKKHGHKKRHKDERSQEGQKGGDYQKRRENEVECYEKSTLTEEHGHGVGPQNSSDSTLNSSKRQKLSLPPDSGHNSESIIRIRLPSQRHKDPEVLPTKEQPCSTSGKIDEAFVQGTHEHVPRPGRELEEHSCSTANIRFPELTPKLSKETPFFSSGAPESVARSAEASLPTSLCSSCSPTLALGYKNLVEDWVVPTLQTELAGFADEDWLFQRKQNVDHAIKSSEDGNIGTCQMNSTSWPHARFLPEADIYALPFTVPL
ncbi:uncharacterized protein LOC120122524 isoform X2 [Hibiscus syriacus]|uniref:uncharacterized protein LOC120122524 isoform X1 n=1 Tax=Hibiscus syriacus TaxID=106335 RepID=UPI001920C75F|nr:uncharacterized protein LOC120122524 isoform X1 [Hibiscus syriacus]XP_038997590.1 uncharacterized protein LOC120122524 isoform X2 [Hibiscus syriacus]